MVRLDESLSFECEALSEYSINQTEAVVNVEFTARWDLWMVKVKL